MIETIKEFNPQTQLTFKDEKEKIDIFNPNIELLEPSTKAVSYTHLTLPTTAIV